MQKQSLSQPKKGVGSEPRFKRYQHSDLEHICFLLRVHWPPQESLYKKNRDCRIPQMPLHPPLCRDRVFRWHSGVKALSLVSGCQRVLWHISLLAPGFSWEAQGSEYAPGIPPAPVPLSSSKALLTWDAPPYGCPKCGKAIAADLPGAALPFSF